MDNASTVQHNSVIGHRLPACKLAFQRHTVRMVLLIRPPTCISILTDPSSADMTACSTVRPASGMRLQVQGLQPAAVRGILLDLPGLLFFSTYTLLVLFWAEIYHQARNIPTSTLRPAFMGFNALVYGVQVRYHSPSEPNL